jgi:hypothetical protein
MENQPNWINNPTPSQVNIVTLLWAIAVLLLFGVMTDVLSVSPFQRKYVMLWFFMIGVTLLVVKVHQNFRKRK